MLGGSITIETYDYSFLNPLANCWYSFFLLEDDFSDFCDLFLACIILQKQIECIDGKKENIIIPSVRINAIREQELAGKRQLTQ